MGLVGFLYSWRSFLSVVINLIQARSAIGGERWCLDSLTGAVSACVQSCTIEMAGVASAMEKPSPTQQYSQTSPN